MIRAFLRLLIDLVLTDFGVVNRYKGRSFRNIIYMPVFFLEMCEMKPPAHDQMSSGFGQKKN